MNAPNERIIIPCASIAASLTKKLARARRENDKLLVEELLKKAAEFRFNEELFYERMNNSSRDSSFPTPWQPVWLLLLDSSNDPYSVYEELGKTSSRQDAHGVYWELRRPRLSDLTTHLLVVGLIVAIAAIAVLAIALTVALAFAFDIGHITERSAELLSQLSAQLRLWLKL